MFTCSLYKEFLGNKADVCWLKLGLIRDIQQHDVRTWNAHNTVDALMLFLVWMTEGLTHLLRIVEYSVSIKYGNYRCIRYR
jgi:hypothetical protein